MVAKPQSEIDAEAWEAKQFEQLKKKVGAGAELVAAVRLARFARTEAGLDCDYTADGEAKFKIQQGLKAAVHGREDAAAALILQVKVIERLDRLLKMSWWIIGILILLLLKAYS